MYAPLGTQMALPDLVQVWGIFANTFSGNTGIHMRRWNESQEPAEWLSLAPDQSDSGDMAEEAGSSETADETTHEKETLRQRGELAKDLRVGFYLLPWLL
jgi:hypothetical protein